MRVWLRLWLLLNFRIKRCLCACKRMCRAASLFRIMGTTRRFALGANTLFRTPNQQGSQALVESNTTGGDVAKSQTRADTDSRLRDLGVALAGLLPGSSGCNFLAKVLRFFSFLWFVLGPNSGPVFGPKNGSCNTDFNRIPIARLKLGPKKGSQKRTHF